MKKSVSYRMNDFEYKICVEYNDCSECPFGKRIGEYYTCSLNCKDSDWNVVEN